MYIDDVRETTILSFATITVSFTFVSRKLLFFFENSNNRLRDVSSERSTKRTNQTFTKRYRRTSLFSSQFPHFQRIFYSNIVNIEILGKLARFLFAQQIMCIFLETNNHSAWFRVHIIRNRLVCILKKSSENGRLDGDLVERLSAIVSRGRT